MLKLDRKVRRNLVAAMRKANVRNLSATLVLKIRSDGGHADGPQGGGAQAVGTTHPAAASEGRPPGRSLKGLGHVPNE